MLRLALCTATFALTVGPAIADPMPYLPIDRPIEAEVMELDAPDEFVRLRNRLRNAMNRDIEWFLSHVGEAGSLAAVRYDERLGMTEAEFERYLNYADLDTDVKVAGYIDLDAHSDMTGMNLTFAVTPDNHPLNNIRYNGEEDYFVTKFGRLTKTARFVGRVMSPEIGPWEGVEYSLYEQDQNKITMIGLSVGQREQDSRYVLEYTIGIIERNKGVRSYATILFYDL